VAILRRMGRLSPHFSDEQRQAWIGAMLDGYSAQEAAGAAATGELGLDPFEVAPSTIRGWLEFYRRTEGVEQSGSQEAKQARRMAQETIAAVEKIPPAERTSKAAPRARAGAPARPPQRSSRAAEATAEARTARRERPDPARGADR
jgi:hypothetical protein